MKPNNVILCMQCWVRMLPNGWTKLVRIAEKSLRSKLGWQKDASTIKLIWYIESTQSIILSKSLAMPRTYQFMCPNWRVILRGVQISLLDICTKLSSCSTVDNVTKSCFHWKSQHVGYFFLVFLYLYCNLQVSVEFKFEARVFGILVNFHVQH